MRPRRLQSGGARPPISLIARARAKESNLGTHRARTIASPRSAAAVYFSFATLGRRHVARPPLRFAQSRASCLHPPHHCICSSASSRRASALATNEAFAGMAAAAAQRTPALFGPLVRGSFYRALEQCDLSALGAPSRLEEQRDDGARRECSVTDGAVRRGGRRMFASRPERQRCRRGRLPQPLGEPRSARPGLRLATTPSPRDFRSACSRSQNGRVWILEVAATRRQTAKAQ